MKFFEATSTIHAMPERIWEILVDAAGYARWESGVVKVEGKVAPGAKLKVTSEANPGKAFPVKVVEVTPPRSMTWAGGMPIPGLFKGERTYRLEPANDGSVRFTMREEYTGLLHPLIFKSIPDLNPSFEKFVKGLKAEAECA